MNREITDPKIVSYARNGFGYYTKAGDSTQAALAKSINSALAKLWRKRPLDMSNARNIERYGEQYSELERLVLSDGE